MPAIRPYDLNKIRYFKWVDHPESLSVGPGGEAYTTGTGGQVYRLDVESNTAKEFASTAPRRMLGQAVDADGNLYCADIGHYCTFDPIGNERCRSPFADQAQGKRRRCAPSRWPVRSIPRRTRPRGRRPDSRRA